jgi:dTMP kinase
MFISFEANEGAGKTTQVALLVEALAARGHDVLRTREPGGSAGAEEIRSLLVQGDPDRWSAMTELLLFNAARRDHLERTIRPALAAGKIVICDRYVGSTLALQVAGGASADRIVQLHELACDGQMPDLTIYLDIDPEVSLARSNGRLAQDESAESRFELKGDSFHARVSREFERQAVEYGWARINADQSIDKVHADILSVIQPLLLKKAG